MEQIDHFKRAKENGEMNMEHKPDTAQLLQDNTDMAPKKLEEDEGNVFLGIKMKKDATKLNLFSIFYVFFLMTTIGGYINVQIVYLLRDTTYFDMEADRQGRVTSNILLAAITCGLCWVMIAGYIYDLAGRKMPIFLAGAIGSGFLVLCPYTSPSIMWLTFVRAVIQMCLAQFQAHPLIMDYVK